MAPRKETNARETALESTELWEEVEEDVEKKRHVKNPFRETYVTLVAAPFDVFLAKTSERERPNLADDVDMEHGGALEDTEDHVSLQHEISARSQQVHLRLEILRRQMQCLVEESSAVLDTGSHVSKRDARKKKKVVDAAESAADESGNQMILNLERALERASLYESGDLSDLDLQKTWNRHHCNCTKHEVTGAEAKLASMKESIDDEYRAFCEQHTQQLVPRLLDEKRITPPDNDGMARILEECKRSIKPFFLEDFLQLETVVSQQDVSSQVTVNYQTGRPVPSTSQVSAHGASPQEDVQMGGEEVLDEISSHTSHSNLELASAPSEVDIGMEPVTSVQLKKFSVVSVRATRHNLHDRAMKIRNERPETRVLPVCVSRHSHETERSASQSIVQLKLRPLLCDSKKWCDLSMSIIDPGVDLIEVRKTIRDELEEHFDTENSLPDDSYTFTQAYEQTVSQPCLQLDTVESNSTVGQLHVQEVSTLAKRRLQEVGVSQNKKARVNGNIEPQRQLTLRTMMNTIREVFDHVAQSSCVSYLSTLLRSDLGSSSPQRAFVALVFSASLANIRQDPAEPPSSMPFYVNLQTASGGGDVKIVCKPE